LTRRVGVTQRVEILADRNERRDALDQAWIPLLVAQDLVPVPVPNQLDDPAAWVVELGITGLVLTGGNDLADVVGAKGTAPERDETEYRLLELAIDRSWPVLAVCRGLQLLVRHQGGITVPSKGTWPPATPSRWSKPVTSRSSTGEASTASTTSGSRPTGCAATWRSRPWPPMAQSRPSVTGPVPSPVSCGIPNVTHETMPTVGSST